MQLSLASPRAILKGFLIAVLTLTSSAYAQTASYHLHQEASATPGLKELSAAGPDSAIVALLTADLKAAPVGEYLIQDFDTQAADPADSGTIPSGSTATFTMWMRKTASVGTVFPRAKLYLNSASGTPVCTATGATALSTKLASISLSCTTSSAITVSSNDRFYLWVGVNLTGTSSSSTLQGELDIEGTLGGHYDSTATVPVPAAVITALAPSTGAVGASVTITGQNFGAAQGSSTVSFASGKISMPTSWSPTQIVAPVPSRAISGNITVTVGGGVSNGVNFNVVPPPSISGVSPQSGAAGTPVTITGANFGATTPLVKFNGVAATISGFSATSITTSVPLVASIGNVVVTASGVDSNGVAFTVPAPTITSLSPASGIPGTTVTIAGANFGSVSGGVTFNGASAIVTTWSDGLIVVLAPNGLTSGNVVVTSGSLTSNAVPFSALTPNITSIAPTSGTGSTQVTISGTGFGSSQDTGSVWLGSTLGNVVSWSDNQIIAKVSPGSNSGFAQVQRPGVSSNSVAFTVNAPSISSLSPASGTPGTQVTITGSGFGSAQGSGEVWLGTAPAAVSSWSDTQIAAIIATDSRSGVAQVLQNGSLSNAVSYAITTPQITSVNPGSGGAGASITVSGSGFGVSQGTGVVWLGSAPGAVVSWSDTQIVATVDPAAVSGIAHVQQNGIWSKPVPFTVPPSLGQTSVTLSPSLISLVVGETRSVQALDSNGQPVTGLAWASSDTGVATLSTDDPPIITAVAPGHASITAGSSSADLTVYPGPELPLGTVQWSSPGDGSGVVRILPAVPNETGVADVFALQSSGAIQAITGDGKVAWSSNVGNNGELLLPDFQGGLVVADDQTIKKLEGLTGQPNPAYTLVNPSGIIPPVLVHTDGTILTVDGDSVVGIDPATGTPKFSIQIEDSIFSSDGNCGEFLPSESTAPPDLGKPIIAGDGFAYFPYVYTVAPLATNFKKCFDSSNPTDGDVIEQDFTHIETHLRLLRVATDGSSAKIVLGDWIEDKMSECVYFTNPPYDTGAECNHTRTFTSASGGVPDENGLLGSLITNADQGVAYSWTLDLGDAPAIYKLTPIIGGVAGSTAALAVSGTVTPMLQASDGTYFGTSQGSNGNLLISFDPAGHLRYTLPGDEYTLDHVDANDRLVARSFSTPTLVTFDSTGNSTSETAGGLIPSWTGGSYQYGSVESVVQTVLDLSGSFGALLGGNHSGTDTAIQQVLSNQVQGGEKQLPVSGLFITCAPPGFGIDLPPNPTCGNVNAIELLTDKSADFIFQNYIQTFRPGIRNLQSNNQPNNDVMIFTAPGGQTIDVTGSGQTLTIELQGIAKLGQGPFSVLTERFDPANHVISAVTLKGHPLAGWRYWRVYSLGTNDIVVETGAYDQPGPGLKNYIGYYLAEGTVSLGWEHYLEFIQNDLQVPQGHSLNHLGQNPAVIQQDQLRRGFWDYFGNYTSYILDNVCQAASCN